MASTIEETVVPTTEPTLGVNFFYESPSAWPFVIFWIACPLLAIATWLISWNNISGHRQRAQDAGLGESEKVCSWYSSFGVRVDLTTDLLVLPMVYSLCGCLDVFRPELADFTIFLRTVWLSKATVRTMRLYFVRSGGFKILARGLVEGGPVKPKAPPFCCFFAWPCCARMPTFYSRQLPPFPAYIPLLPWHIPFLRYGIYQYTVCGPLFAILNIVLKSQAVVTGGADSRIQYTTIAASIYTTISIWCYRNMAEFFGPVIQKICLANNDNTFNPKEGRFVVMHYLFASITNLLLSNLLQEGHDNGNWYMSPATLATVINGFATCIVELLLALMALKLFPHNETSYPPIPKLEEGWENDPTIERHKGLPLDTIPLLQMYGIPTSQWEIFDPDRRATSVRIDEPSPASNRPTKPRPAPEAVGKEEERGSSAASDGVGAGDVQLQEVPQEKVATI